MADKPTFISEKVSNIGGEVVEKKKDGYASGTVPKSMIGNKPGKTDKVGYSGPNYPPFGRG